MAHYLIIDQGNTSTKLTVTDSNGNSVRTACADILTPSVLQDITEGATIDNAIFCSVGTMPDQIEEELRHIAHNVIMFSADTPTPLAVDYHTPSTLGADRLAAAVGAYSMPQCNGRDLLIADLGTAATYDRVSADGHFLGGIIAPGIRLRLKALNQFTARLPLVDDNTMKLCARSVWGTDTTSAIACGAFRGVVAEIAYYRSMMPSTAIVILTGGDATTVSPFLPFEHIVESNLVTRGLYNVILHNIPA